MTINHINLVVNNVSQAVNFFETYFGFKCELIKGENVIAILKNEENFTLVISSSKDGANVYPKDFHIGFMLNDAGEVDSLYQKLKVGNIVLSQEPRKIRNSYGFYFYFDNLFIEVGQQD